MDKETKPQPPVAVDADRECRTFDGNISAVEVRGDDDNVESLHLVGYAAMFDKRTTIFPGFDEIIAPGAFTNTLKKGDDVRALFNHDSNLVLGRNKANTLSLLEDDKGLHYDITLPDTQLARDLHTSVKRGDVSGSSFAFQCITDERDTSNPKCMLRTLKEVKLFDVSPVTYPAYKQAKVSARMEAAFNEFFKMSVLEEFTHEPLTKQQHIRQRALAAMLGISRSQTEQE